METTTEKPKRVYNFAQILPNNERVRVKLELEKLEEEERLRLEIEKQKKKEEVNTDEILRLQQLERERKQKLKELENQKEDIKERTLQIQQMEGNFTNIIRELMNNTSPYELSFAGLELDKWNFTSLMLFLPENLSLLTLNLSRKKLGDEQAKEISNMLKRNRKLRRLELEGNEFGPDSAKYFAEALTVNRTLRYLDLENNNLTNRGEDSDGIIALFEALKDNTMLISLNLSNNFLTPACGQAILYCLRKNNILVHLEIFQNQRFEEWSKENPKHSAKGENDSKFVREGLNINQVNDIKEAIKRNKEKYDKMRTLEWKERGVMKTDELDIIKYEDIVSEKKLEEEIKIADKKGVEKFYLDNFEKHIEDLEKQFIMDVEQYCVETKARLEKKSKKRKAPAKKK